MKILDILNENWGNSRQFGAGERPQDQQLIEKSTTEKQARTMAAAAHDAKFAKKVGIKQSVAKEFNRADTGTKQLSKAMKHKPKNEVIDPGVGMGSAGGQWANSKMEEDWNKVNHHDHTNGLSQKAVNAYRREHPGSKLKTAVTTKPSKLKKGSKAAKRRKSFCARMSGNKGPMKKPNGKPTPKALALRRWNCESIEEMAQMILEGQQMIAEIKKGAKDSNGFTKCWPGKHAAGTKKGKNGGQVRNCVPNESQDVAEAISRKDLLKQVGDKLNDPEFRKTPVDPNKRWEKGDLYQGPGPDDYGYTGYQGHGMPTDKAERARIRADKKKGVAEGVGDWMGKIANKAFGPGSPTEIAGFAGDKDYAQHYHTKAYPAAIQAIAQGGGVGSTLTPNRNTNAEVARAKSQLAHILRAKGVKIDPSNYDELITNKIKADVAKAMGQSGVAEGSENKENPNDQVRNKLNAWMEQDQQYTNPTRRASFQAKVWPYIQQNIKTILADKGEKGNGDYPAAPYAAWLLVQHMDAYPQNQIEFYNALKQAIPNHPKIQFLRDRAAVNRWIMKNASNPEYFIKGKALPNPTVNVRNPDMFKDAGIVATSREEALQNAQAAGNKLLVAAVQATNAQTQPSYKQDVAEGLENNNTTAQKIFFARSNKTPKGWSYDHVGFITQDGRQIQMSGHKGNDVYVTSNVTDDPEFPKQHIKIVSLSKPVSVPTTNSVGAENCGTFVANVLQANGIKGIDTQKIYSVFKEPVDEGYYNKLDVERQEQGLLPVFEIGRYQNGRWVPTKQYNNYAQAQAHAQNIKNKYPSMEVGIKTQDGQVKLVGLKEEAGGAKQAAIAIAKKESGKYTKNGKRLKEQDMAEGILPVGPVVAAMRMFNRRKEAYELFTKKFPSQQAAEQWASKYNAELHNISPAGPSPARPVDLDPMVDQIKLAQKMGNESIDQDILAFMAENFAEGRNPAQQAAIAIAKKKKKAS